MVYLTSSASYPVGFNIEAGMQDLELHSLTLSNEVPAIYCQFCLGDYEEQVDESVILRWNQCRRLAHLSYVEEWLEKRDTGPLLLEFAIVGGLVNCVLGWT
jgi:hypothetical protein